MNATKHEQVSLSLQSLTDQSRAALNESIKHLYGIQAASGHLRSSSTVQTAVSIMEKSGEIFIATGVRKASALARTIDAFSILQISAEVYIRFMELKLDDVLQMSGAAKDRMVMTAEYREGKLLFEAVRSKLIRHIESHRVAFLPADTVSFTTTSVNVSSEISQPPKNRGGKPMSPHWDDMWATLAVKLYSGELNPKTQAEIEEAIKQWFSDNSLEIGDTAARGRARKLWQRLSDTD